jgi:hypothetical protein
MWNIISETPSQSNESVLLPDSDILMVNVPSASTNQETSSSNIFEERQKLSPSESKLFSLKNQEQSLSTSSLAHIDESSSSQMSSSLPHSQTSMKTRTDVSNPLIKNIEPMNSLLIEPPSNISTSITIIKPKQQTQETINSLKENNSSVDLLLTDHSPRREPSTLTFISPNQSLTRDHLSSSTLSDRNIRIDSKVMLDTEVVRMKSFK